jgi:hypothetical protein
MTRPDRRLGSCARLHQGRWQAGLDVIVRDVVWGDEFPTLALVATLSETARNQTSARNAW